jgi:hypothetical protein
MGGDDSGGCAVADMTTIMVAVVGAVATVSSGLGGSLGGYFLAGRNEEAKDVRAIERDEAARNAALVEQLQEQRHETQRETLLELQDQLHALVRATGVVLLQDVKTAKEHGRLFMLPESMGGEESMAATVAVQKLQTRVLDAGLRTQIDDFRGFCATANTGLMPFKDGPADVLLPLIEGLLRELDMRYALVVEAVGEQLRRELDRP